MKFEYTLAELSTAITALEQVYGKVSVLDPYLGTVLDPATLQPTDKAEELTALDETGRGVQLAQADDGPELVLYQGIQADALSWGCTRASRRTPAPACWLSTAACPTICNPLPGPRIPLTACWPRCRRSCAAIT